jgi:hypothetical protein
MDVCRGCGCTELQAIEDIYIRTLSLPSGTYTYCQVVAWADEQGRAWLDAANEDGKGVDDVIRPLERVEQRTNTRSCPHSPMNCPVPCKSKYRTHCIN